MWCDADAKLQRAVMVAMVEQWKPFSREKGQSVETLVQRQRHDLHTYADATQVSVLHMADVPLREALGGTRALLIVQCERERASTLIFHLHQTFGPGARAGQLLVATASRRHALPLIVRPAECVVGVWAKYGFRVPEAFVEDGGSNGECRLETPVEDWCDLAMDLAVQLNSYVVGQ